MLTAVLPDQLRNVPLFRQFSPDEIGQILARCETITQQAGDIVLQSGDRERALYVLVEGTIEVVLEIPGLEESIISTLAPGSVFGEGSFFHDAPHAATVRSTSAATLVRLRRTEFDALLKEDSLPAYRLGLNAAEILASRLHTTDQWVCQLLGEERSAVAASWRRFREGLGGSFDFPRGFTHTT
ncbi:MAG TPA: cyclic nucleotide-binding domain-containing protein [Pirellulales bacterium]|nr:cyclic nucleotide-binding domain-containing protein [Pirellulales bacterium]